MSWLRERFARARTKVRTSREDSALPAGVRDHLQDFAATRLGVEAWIEQPTGFNPASVLLVALDGEWTRRRVPSADWARDFAARNSLPAHDAGLVAYPRRMREWDEAHRPNRGDSSG